MDDETLARRGPRTRRIFLIRGFSLKLKLREIRGGSHGFDGRKRDFIGARRKRERVRPGSVDGGNLVQSERTDGRRASDGGNKIRAGIERNGRRTVRRAAREQSERYVRVFRTASEFAILFQKQVRFRRGCKVDQSGG